MSNLQPAAGIPQTPQSIQATYPGSPVASMHTHPSTTNMNDHTQQFSSLPHSALSGPLGPVQQARLNASASATDMTNLAPMPTSPTSTKDSSGQERQRRTSSMTINPSIMSQQTPGGSVPSPQQLQHSWHADGEPLGLTRTTSSATLDGEPRIFPGVVSRSTRRSSARGSVVEDSSHTGFRKAETGSVVEERDTDDDE